MLEQQARKTKAQQRTTKRADIQAKIDLAHPDPSHQTVDTASQ